MSARQAMTMRTSILRNEGTADEFGAEIDRSMTPVATDVACCCYYDNGRLQAQASGSTPIGALTILLPVGTDVTPDDQIGDVTDRRGTVLFAGPFTINGPVGRRRDHVTFVLTEV